MTKAYGLPYMGSKNAVAEDIVSHLPSGKRFVDLFCGGCAMTHAAILSGKYDSFLINDLNGEMPRTFLSATRGEFNDETRWISRDDFNALRDSDPYVRICYSFCNNCVRYMYCPEIEPYRKACHLAVMFDEWELFSTLCPEVCEAARSAMNGMPMDTWQQRRARRLKLAPAVLKRMRELFPPKETLDANPLYRSLLWKIDEKSRKMEAKGRFTVNEVMNLERIQSLTGLANGRIVSSECSYENVPFQEGDVVYADPPYAGTWNEYGSDFNTPLFWEWVRTRDYPVYVSEYVAPEDFVCVWKKEKTRIGAGGTSSKYGKATEKLFVHSRWISTLQRSSNVV